MTKAKPLPSQARLKEAFNYDPSSGVLTWRIAPNGRIKVGDAIKFTQVYVNVQLDGQLYKAHRIIWMYAYGEDPGSSLVDHKDQDKTNNRLSNLRLATSAQNQANKRQSKGYRYVASRAKWEAFIRVAKKLIFLGRFATEEEARQAYVSAKLHHFGEFAAT